jgi:predicted Fe-Mo cluster-binding NifX family protein
MKKGLKIAIPTDDGLIVRSSFSSSRGFMVATVDSGKIIHQEFRWNLFSEMIISEHGSLYNLCDCDVVIVNEIGECQCQRLKAEKKDVIITVETGINQIFGEYLKGSKNDSALKQIA